MSGNKALVAGVFACFLGISLAAQTANNHGDGKRAAAGVLLVGGQGEDGVNSNSQVYDFTGNIVVDTPAPKYARFGHTATQLKDGRILVVGGVTKLILTGPQPSRQRRRFTIPPRKHGPLRAASTRGARSTQRRGLRTERC